MSSRSADEDDARPSPDELLDRYQLRDTAPQPTDVTSAESIRGPGRGRLRIYIGMAAGVGKTFAMLNEGRRRKSRGTDVVVGYVETHKRPLTQAQIGELEVIPRKQVNYRGITLEEMDVDAILARHPQIALVDELAHTNVPGSAHAKRYQDVEQLLDAGITVIATLNIQHLEGLNDLIEAITGVRQRETLPDRILDEADEVELVDISPEALRSRLRHGNVYPPERAQKALEHYFSPSNLTALRELALRRIAEKTTAQLEAMVEEREELETTPWKAAECVLVAFGEDPHAEQLLRDGWRLARALKASLLAATVLRPGAGTATSENIKAHMRLAEDLGAEVLVVEATDVVAKLAEVARAHHVTQIVIGQQAERPWWQHLLRDSAVNRLLRAGTGADIHVVPAREKTK